MKLLLNQVKQFQIMQKNSYNYDELISCGEGKLFGEGNAKLPLPPMLMFDRITEIKIAANHLNNILSTIDDKETLNDIKLTINAARSITTKIDDMSDDFEKLTQDKELTKSIRDLTIGLSKFLNEIYP